MDPRVVKPRIPASLIVAVSVVGLLILGFIVFSTTDLLTGLSDARKTGTVVSKEFLPAAPGEKQISLGRDGKINASQIEGEFILTVEVPQADGSNRPYKVWMPDRAQFDAIQIGDSFDVGPRLVK